MCTQYCRCFGDSVGMCCYLSRQRSPVTEYNKYFLVKNKKTFKRLRNAVLKHSAGTSCHCSNNEQEPGVILYGRNLPCSRPTSGGVGTSPSMWLAIAAMPDAKGRSLVGTDHTLHNTQCSVYNILCTMYSIAQHMTKTIWAQYFQKQSIAYLHNNIYEDASS